MIVMLQYGLFLKHQKCDHYVDDDILSMQYRICIFSFYLLYVNHVCTLPRRYDVMNVERERDREKQRQRETETESDFSSCSIKICTCVGEVERKAANIKYHNIITMLQ